MEGRRVHVTPNMCKKIRSAGVWFLSMDGELNLDSNTIRLQYKILKKLIARQTSFT
jgi:hypothetical protein